MFPLIIALSLAGAGIKLTGYGKYLFGIRAGTMVPNMATWTLWAFLSSLNSASYLVYSHDVLKSSVALAGTTGCLVTYAYALRKGVMRPLEKWDRASLGIGVLAGLTWIAVGSAGYANVVLQVGFFVSMLPTYRGLLDGTGRERPAPWLLMSGAYALNAVIAVLRWNGDWIPLVYPVLNMVTHGGVGLLAAVKVPKITGTVTIVDPVPGQARDDVSG